MIDIPIHKLDISPDARKRIQHLLVCQQCCVINDEELLVALCDILHEPSEARLEQEYMSGQDSGYQLGRDDGYSSGREDEREKHKEALEKKYEQGLADGHEAALSALKDKETL